MSTVQICMCGLHLYAWWFFIRARLLNLLNRLIPQSGKQMHHCCPVSDKIVKMPACSRASLISRYLPRYCKSITYSSHRLQHRFVTSSLAIKSLSSSFYASSSPQLTLNPFTPFINVLFLLPVYSSSLSNLIFLFWSEQAKLQQSGQ